MDKQQKHSEVIIIGAGAAGIGAATKLLKQGLPFVILQARNRCGGRVLTKKIDGVDVDLGASWIHSYGSQNPLRPYARNLKIEQAVLSKRSVGRIYMDGQENCQFDDDTLEVGELNSSYFYKFADNIAAKNDKQDMSLYEAGKQFLQGTVSKFTPKQRRCTEVLINLTEHYEASSIKQLSANHYEFRKDCGGDFMPQGGYGQFLKKIVNSAQLKVQYGKQVTNICYGDDQVKVVCKDGSFYMAKKVICSLPLGILKSQKVKFDPQLPVQYSKSIKNLGVGLMNKVIVSFEENFWGPVSWITIGCDQRGKFSQVLNISQKDRHILCCFITDDFARKTEKQSDENIVNVFVNLLERLFKKEKIKVKDSVVTRWGTDEYSLGSYSSFHAGSSPQDCYLLRKPIANKVWLVGEHCYAEHLGTAHGAFKTGQWAAEQVLKELKWVNPMWKQPRHYKKGDFK